MLAVKGQNIIRNSNITKVSQSTSKPLHKPPLPKKKKMIKVLKNDYVCDQRRQNNLNSRFIRKKKQLLQITRQNVRLFQKINSQKSLYSHQSLHKSYESNKSLLNSRMSQRSHKSLKKSQVSNYSQASHKSKTSTKNKFFNRATSATSIQKQNKIIIPNTKRNSMVNLKPKAIQETKQEDIQQFARLFNIKQEPTGKQRNRPMRIKSTNVLRPHKIVPKITNHTDRRFSQSKQIIINEENEIEIHEEIQAQQFDTFRAKSSRAQSVQKIDSKKIDKIDQNPNLLLEDDMKINILPCQTEQNLKSSKKSHPSHHLSASIKSERQNIENLFEIKNSNIKSRIQKKIGNEKVSAKYTNLISKINSELNRHVKKPKQNTIYPFRSRLIA